MPNKIPGKIIKKKNPFFQFFFFCSPFLIKPKQINQKKIFLNRKYMIKKKIKAYFLGEAMVQKFVNKKNMFLGKNKQHFVFVSAHFFPI